MLQESKKAKKKVYHFMLILQNNSWCLRSAMKLVDDINSKAAWLAWSACGTSSHMQPNESEANQFYDTGAA